MLWPRYDVFLSYSRTDSERVQPLLDELRRLGYRVFFDVQSIDPGEQWKKRLDRSIRASRTLVLCWSEHSRVSDYITFEYSRAEALHKPVFPWLLDKTPLPAMLEIQGISEPDGARVAAALLPHLGRTLTSRRRLIMMAAALVAIVLAVGIWFSVQPPPPWEFHGRVYDRETGTGIAGVEVVVAETNKEEHAALTDAKGRYTFHLPQPRPKYIYVLFRKDAYGAESDTVPANQECNKSMEKVKGH